MKNLSPRLNFSPSTTFSVVGPGRRRSTSAKAAFSTRSTRTDPDDLPQNAGEFVSIAVARRSTLPGFGLTMGLTLTWLSVIILLPLAALFLKTSELNLDQFWGIVTSRRTLNALKISFGLSFAAALVNLVMGTIIVWALVRYRFPGRRLFDAIVDIPFALPTAVAGVALTQLFAQKGWLGAPLAELGVKVAFTPIGI